MKQRNVSPVGAVTGTILLVLVSYPAIAFLWHGADRPGLATNIVTALAERGLERGVVVSIFLVAIGSVLSVSMTLLAAYAAANITGWRRRLLLAVFAVPLFIRGGIIPFYMVVRAIGLSGSPAAMLLPILGAPIMVLLLMQVFAGRQFREITEAARIDGASEIRILLRIVCPAGPWVVALPLVMAALEFWNSWIPAFLFVNNERLYPLQIVIRDMASFAQTAVEVNGGHSPATSGVLAAAGLIALVPSVGIALLVAFRTETFIAARRNR